jgi:hypothetical protein
MAMNSRAEVIEQVRQFCDKHGLTVHPFGKITPGDEYVAIRNAGPQRLTCLKVSPLGWVVPVGKEGYSYDTWECVKISVKEPVNAPVHV